MASRRPPDRRRVPPTLAECPPRHPSLRTFSPETDLDPRFRAALEAGRIADVIEALHPDLYAVTPFSEGWCQRLVEEVVHVSDWAADVGCRIDPPNSMNHYGVILDEVGLHAALDAAMRAVVGPLAAQLFPEVGGDSLDAHHGFVVEYRPGGDVDLGFHVDDSEVTLNLCLGRVFSGGDLYFEGRRCAEHRQTGCAETDRIVYAHRPGVALLHAGKHRHGALSVTGGERLNLILWCRSGAYRAWAAAGREDCPPWCARSRAR